MAIALERLAQRGAALQLVLQRLALQIVHGVDLGACRESVVAHLQPVLGQPHRPVVIPKPHRPIG